MDSYIMHSGIPSNGFPIVAGLPLFDWRGLALPTSSRLALAQRIARQTGVPLSVVLVHVERAGLGREWF